MANLNFQVLSKGFGSYLNGILPDNVAVSAGAFSATMQQVKNIQNTQFERFAQVASSIETTVGLTLVNGTTVPTNQTLADSCLTLTALGSGPNGTYTMSDFFGSMSGLPYMWKTIYDSIVNVQTNKLSTIYQQLYLAVKWEGASLSVTVTEVTPGDFNATSITIDNAGNGYGRNGASAPTISMPYGATATCTIGTDPDNLSTYGKITSVTITNGGSNPTSAGWYAQIECPSTAYIAYPYTGGSNTSYGTIGWPTMDSVVQSLIDDSNAEIATIHTVNPYNANDLNTIYNNTGQQLTIEQRARYIGIPPVPTVTRDTRLNVNPTATYVFVDSIPKFAQDTLPHMSAQTLEAISDLTTVGGQSIVAMMRSARNQEKLQIVGIPLDDTISGELDSNTEKALLANGTVPLGSPGINGYTTPSMPEQELNNQVVAPEPLGYYDGNNFMTTSSTAAGNPVVDINNPCCCVVVVGTNIPTGNEKVLDTGQPLVLGSLAGAIPIIPINLNYAYNSSTLLPTTYDVQQAIDEVIKCNCDCWVS